MFNRSHRVSWRGDLLWIWLARVNYSSLTRVCVCVCLKGQLLSCYILAGWMNPRLHLFINVPKQTSPILSSSRPSCSSPFSHLNCWVTFFILLSVLFLFFLSLYKPSETSFSPLTLLLNLLNLCHALHLLVSEPLVPSWTTWIPTSRLHFSDCSSSCSLLKRLTA